MIICIVSDGTFEQIKFQFTSSKLFTFVLILHELFLSWSYFF